MTTILRGGGGDRLTRFPSGVRRYGPGPRAWDAARAAMLLLGTLLFVACSSTPDAAPERVPLGQGLPPAAADFQPPSKPNADTPWGRELANISLDGTRSKDSALRLFVIAFGPLPGVSDIPNTDPIRSATAAVRAVHAHWPELTPEQRAAIEARLAPPPGAVIIRIDPAGEPSGPGGTSSAITDQGEAVDSRPLGLRPLAQSEAQKLEAAVRQAAIGVRALVAARFGSDIPGPIDVVLPGVVPGEYGYATFEFQGPGGTYSACHTAVTDLALGGGAPWILDTLAHEIFHCFEANGYRTDAAFSGALDWVIEGAAEWVGNDIGGVLTPTDLWWDDWLTNPSLSLQARTYDALGFWAHLSETGASPWKSFPAVFRTTSGPEAFLATGAAANDAFLDSWASCTTRDPARGTAWDTDGPGITLSSAPVKGQTVANGDHFDFAIAPYAIGLYALSVTADVLMVTSSGHARISDGRIDATAFPSSFCVKQGGCDPCPNAGGAQVPPAPLASDPVLAVTGAASGNVGTLTGMSVEDFCKKDDPKPVWVHIERAANPPQLAGTVLELEACTGKIGPWAGELRVGGLDDGNGFTVAFVELPIAFTITAEGVPATVQVSGTVPTPVFDLDVVYDLQIVVQGNTMSITGTATGDTGLIQVSDAMPGIDSLPIEPAPAGKCP